MQLNIFLFLILILTQSIVQGQNEVDVFNNKDFHAAIFGKDYDPQFRINFSDGRFTPTIKDITTIESLLSLFNSKAHRSKKKYRQILGYMRGDQRIVLVHVMKYDCKKQFNKDYSNWAESFEVLLGSPDESEKSFLYKVNLSEKTIGFY